MAHIYNGQLDAFDLYHKYQETEQQSTSVLRGPALPALGHAIAGSTGAAFSNIFTYPLSLIITRLQIQRSLRNNARLPNKEEYRSIEDAARKIYEEENGLHGFYVGMVSDTSKTVADSFLFFLAYNFLRQSRLRSTTQSKHLPVLDELSVGFLAGAFSKFLTMPIANIVTRKQTSSMLTGRHGGKKVEQGTIRAIAGRIQQEKGLQGFWSGYSASLILTLNPSLTFFFFEMLKRLTLPRSKRSDPAPRITFMLAALSKAMASTITYPFSLAKSRLQAEGASQDEVDAEKNSSDASRRAQPNNVFTAIFRIAQREGVGALYEGLHGEVIKGFFSHGITMIIKDAVHKLVIQLYYAILRLLRRYPTPQEIAGVAKEQVEQKATDVKIQAQQVIESATEGLQDISTDYLGDE